jgi:hypothetical protein
MAHLDITHYKSLTYEEERNIQNMANQIVLEGHHITKMCKDLTDLFGWDVDQNSLQQHERRKLLKERKQKNAIK